MSKTYLVMVKEVVFHTHEIEMPDGSKIWDVRDYFYNLEPDEQAKTLISSDSFETVVDDVEEAD